MKVNKLCNNCYVIQNEGWYYLQSYEFIVAMYKIGTDWTHSTFVLGRRWNYSITTLKHLYRFIEEYIPEISLERNRKRTIEEMLELNLIDYDDMLV